MAADVHDTVMLIDPDREGALETLELIRAQGHQVLRAETHLQGLSRLEDVPADVALVPVEETDIDGFEFCRLVRRREREQRSRFIYLILMGEQGHREGIVQSGGDADDFLLRPCLDEELVWRVQSGLRIMRRLEAVQSQLRFDPERSVLSRDGLRLCLQDEVNRAIRRGTRLSLLFLTLQGLDLAEKSYGQGWLQWFLERVQRTVRESLRSYDRMAQTAPGSLCLVLPDTEASGLSSVMNRLEAALDQLLQSFPGQELLEVRAVLSGVSLDAAPEYAGVFEAVQSLMRWIESQRSDVLEPGRIEHGRLSRGGVELP